MLVYHILKKNIEESSHERLTISSLRKDVNKMPSIWKL